jgi:CheY-like chemotaxis protein
MVVVGPAGTIEHARKLIETEKFDAAFVDANLGGHPVGELADALTKRNIPFLFLTGYGRDSLPHAFRQCGVVAKPYTCEQLLAAAVRILSPAGAKI